ncbi:MAG TPA: alpha/beta fold hydrolase [Solirubrobacteraceae bacterium]|nr:alpha/beta fold hydrolase [Solirubrobacteraceae bacterium]
MHARRLPAFLAGIVLALAGAAVLPVAAGAALGTTSCGGGFLCGSLDAPLDHSGAQPGTVTLQYARLPAASAPTTNAIVGLAGGPGQAALPLAGSFAADLGAFDARNDLLVFDQRGTGASGALSCAAFGNLGPTTAASVRACAQELGAPRGFYRSVDSADDLETLRVAGGYDKLILYGVSYGTKVALAYAARYPDHVAALILDSVVPLDGPDPFSRPSFAAVPRVLRELCANGACKAATKNPRADLVALVAHLERHALRSTITSPNGGRLHVTLTAIGLWQVLLAGDLNPALRAELPGAMRAALLGDPTPILRLRARAAGLSGTAGARAAPTVRAAAADQSDALFAATRCEETPFPWDRAAGAATREVQARAAAARLPASTFAPFGREVALDASVMPLCAAWPDASPAPASHGPLPNVPTLVLTGAADLRTPVEQARAAVATIPDAQVDVVAQTGHSVLGSDLGGCAAKTLAAFAAGTTVACTPDPSPITPTPMPPRTLGALPGPDRAAKTLAAVRATIDDVRRQLIGDAIAAERSITPGSRTGGLRGGVATVEGGFITFHRVSYVPGVRVSGTYATSLAGATAGVSHLAVTGPAAAKGTITIDASGTITGNLGGRSINAHTAGARSALLQLRRGLAVPAFADPALRVP